MKRLSILLAIIGALFAGGCADPLEQTTTQEVQQRFQRGISGQGQLGPLDRPEGDQANEHAVPQTHP